MKESKVYFTDFHTTLTENLQQKLWRLLASAGMGEIDFDKKICGHQTAFRRTGQSGVPSPKLGEDRC